MFCLTKRILRIATFFLISSFYYDFNKKMFVYNWDMVLMEPSDKLDTISEQILGIGIDQEIKTSFSNLMHEIQKGKNICNNSKTTNFPNLFRLKKH